MEPYNDLASLRDMTASQLDILLRYDSPPETPNQPTQMLLSSSPQSIENNNYNKINEVSRGDSSTITRNLQADDEAVQTNCSLMQFNREQLSTQMPSQIDFSIFHDCADDMNDDLNQSWHLSASTTQKNQMDESVIMTTPKLDHITLDNTELPDEAPTNGMRYENETNRRSQNLSTTINDNIDKMLDDDLDYDGILEHIDFKQLSCIEEAYWTTKQNVDKSLQRQCQTQVKHQNVFKPIDRVIASCPAPVAETSSEYYCCSTHATNLSQFSEYADLPIESIATQRDEIVESYFELNSFENIQDFNTTEAKNKDVLQFIASPTPNIPKEKDNETNNVNGINNVNSQFSEYADLSVESVEKQQEENVESYFKLNSLENIQDFNTSKNKDALQFIASPTENISKEINNRTNNVNGINISINNVNSTTAGTSSTSFGPHCSGNTTADASSMPSSVKQLFDVVKSQYSDFAFIYALSAQLCQDRIPMECFVTLKMALLLSLASIGHNPDCPPIPIVAIGNDSYMTDYLLTNVGQLGTRFVGPTDDSKPPSSNGYRNHNWIEADPILLAKGGVYYVGDWSRLKLRRSEKLFKDIECSNVAVDKSTQQYPLETAVWTHWRSFKYNAKDQQMFNKFVKIFGIPIFVAEDNHETLVNYTLEQASIRVFESTVDHLSINSDDMREFLVKVSQRNVDLTPSAAMLLRKYFVASRSARQDCLTKQGYVMLKQFAESFAKLSLRHEVLSIDALAAIILCEHSIESIFGSSDNPPPHFGAIPFVGAVDEYIVEFQQWLDSYIEKYTK